MIIYKNNNYYRNNDLDDPIEEFAPRARELLLEYKKKRKLSHIARQLGFHPSRLTEMITKDGNGDYKRRVTPYYLAKLIDGGFIDVYQLLQGRSLEDLPERHRIFFERMILSKRTVQLVIEAQRKGIDIDNILELILHPGKNSHLSTSG